MLQNNYHTINKTYTGLYKEKGSKFLSFVYPVSETKEIKKLIEQLHKEHFGARHICWAYKIGFQGETFRAFDDGEPHNSAGTPILGQINSYSLTNILICVVRYFGGTLLGVGGLIQAYKEAAKNALEGATIITKEVELFYSISFPYTSRSAIDLFFKKIEAKIMHETYAEDCILTYSIPQRNNELSENLSKTISINSAISIKNLNIYE